VATVVFEQAGGERAEFTFDEHKGSADALVIHTTRVGVAGSRLVLSIDHSPRDLFSRVLKADECKFGENGSECMIAIAGDDPLYAAIATAFRLGRRAHLTIEDAGNEQMSASSSLDGFAAAYDG
jgi:hypothetical protein